MSFVSTTFKAKLMFPVSLTPQFNGNKRQFCCVTNGIHRVVCSRFKCEKYERSRKKGTCRENIHNRKKRERERRKND